ncbi:MAG: helix-turn-helix domain-containing protein [Christensenellales bacterium]
MVDFGIKLAKLRENKRLSQSQLAARLGITKSMVSAYENSARMPSYAVLLRIAGMFNVSLELPAWNGKSGYIPNRGTERKPDSDNNGYNRRI